MSYDTLSDQELLARIKELENKISVEESPPPKKQSEPIIEEELEYDPVLGPSYEQKITSKKQAVNQSKKKLRKIGIGSRAALAGIGDIDFGLAGLGNKIEDTFDKATSNRFRPQNEEEEDLSDLVRSVSGVSVPGTGAAKALKMIGSPAKGANIGRKLLDKYLKIQKVDPGLKSYATSSTAAAVGSKAARESERAGDDPWLSALSGIGAGMGVHYAPHAVRAASQPIKTSSKVAGKFVGLNPEKVSIHKELDMPYDLPSVSDSKAIHNLSANIQQTGALEKDFQDISKQRSKIAKEKFGIGENPLSKAEQAKQITETLKKGYNAEAAKQGELRNEYADILSEGWPSHKEGFKAHKVDVTNARDILKETMPEEIIPYGPHAGKQSSAYLDWKKSDLGKTYNKLAQWGNKTIEIPLESLNKIKTEIGDNIKTMPASGTNAERVLNQTYAAILDGEKAAHQTIQDPIKRARADELFDNYREHWKEVASKFGLKDTYNEYQKNIQESAHKTFKKFIKNFEDGKKDFEFVEKYLDPHEEKKFFGNFMDAMGTKSDGTFSFNEIANKFNHLDKEQKKLISDMFSRANHSTPETFDKMMKVFKFQSAPLASKNTSWTGAHIALDQDTRQIASAMKDLAAGNGKNFVSKSTDYILQKVIPYAIGKKILTNQNFLKFLDYGLEVKHPNQVPILFKKMEKVPGISQNSVKKLKNAYRMAHDDLFNTKGKGRILLASLSKGDIRDQEDEE